MARFRLTAAEWKTLSKAEKLDLLALMKYEEGERAKLLHEITEKLPNEFGILAQVLILLQNG